MLVTVNVTSPVEEGNSALDIEQLPVDEVRQLLEVPPGMNVPLTVAFGMAAPELVSRTAVVTTAFQLFPDFVPDPVRFLMATV